jgi:large subunit ribosomal protein L18
MKALIKKTLRRQRRKMHVRKHVSGTPQRPRLTVFRSHKNIYAQLIDDIAARTLVAASSMEKPLRVDVADAAGKVAAQKVGAALAVKAVQAGIKKVVFDRNGYPFHGRVRELAEAARKAGLQF